MIEIVAGILVAAVAVALVLQPLLSGERVTVAGPSEAVNLEESESPKIQALLALREIEFDRATGKLSEEDYLALKAKYSRAAVEAMRAEATAGTAEWQDGRASEGLDAAAEAAVRRVRGDRRDECAACGPRPEAVAVFCSSCGRRLGRPDALPRCWVCGAELPDGAKYCARCGDLVAA